jgi:hypothetical protein
MRPLIPQNLTPSLHSPHQLLGARVTIIMTPEVKSPERSLGSLQVLLLLLTEEVPPIRMVYPESPKFFPINASFDGHFKQILPPFYFLCNSCVGQDHTFSVDSGVGASVSRSMDEGPMDESSVVHKRTSLPAPPPLLPKSRSLDHAHPRDKHQDSDMVVN